MISVYCKSITRMLINRQQAANYASNNPAFLTTQHYCMARLRQATQTESKAGAGCGHLESKAYVFRNLIGEEEKGQLFTKLGEKAAGICEPQKEECFWAWREHANVGFRLHNYSPVDNGIINNSHICLSQTKGCRCYSVWCTVRHGKKLIKQLYVGLPILIHCTCSF